MSDAPLFQNADEQERIYAPDQVPETAGRARLEGDADMTSDAAIAETPSAAPVFATGTSASAVAAPPNVAPDGGDTAPGDPGTRGRDPLDTDNNRA